ncbi:hypothetical protein EW146_g3871, partial [Bondarzewia mesenterica]
STPTVAETGVPVSAGAGGPGPSSGSLRDIKAPPSDPRIGSLSAASTVPGIPEKAPLPPSPQPPPVESTGKFESAEEEKKRLEREERERLLQGADRDASTSHESAEDEKKRLEKEERERVLRGETQGDKKPDSDGPPPYQDF